MITSAGQKCYACFIATRRHRLGIKYCLSKLVLQKVLGMRKAVENATIVEIEFQALIKNV